MKYWDGENTMNIVIKKKKKKKKKHLAQKKIVGERADLERHNHSAVLYF